MNKALICMAIHDTPENQRHEYTKKTVDVLMLYNIHLHHDLYLISNGNCMETHKYLMGLPKQVNVILNPTNIGTARAINQGLKFRKKGQHAIKMDNDVIVCDGSFVSQMIEVVTREPKIGIVGLKRKDLRQTTWDEDPEYRSELIMLPHEPGQRWINVEKTRDIMGTCTLINSDLLDKVGYFYQIGKYGFDDVFMSWRSNIEGFMNVHLSHIEIDHIDRGDNPYQQWKENSSHVDFEETKKQINEMLQKTRSTFVDFY